MSGYRPRFFLHQDGLHTDGGPPPEIGSEVILSAEDSHHASRVLRLREGDMCEAVVGLAVYAATVTRGDQPVRIELRARLEGQASGALYRVRVGLVQALARPSPVDQLLEKGTEVGASFFLLLPSAGSPGASVGSMTRRLERRRRIVLEAAKQSKQVEVPDVAVVESVEQALERLGAAGTVSLVLDPGADVLLEDEVEKLRASLSVSPPADATEVAVTSSRQSVALWVGPEGGWSIDELEKFSGVGLEPFRMGRSVLRTETAGPVAVAVTRLVLGDW